LISGESQVNWPFCGCHWRQSISARMNFRTSHSAWCSMDCQSLSCWGTTGGVPPKPLPPWLTVGYRIDCHEAPVPPSIWWATSSETAMETPFEGAFAVGLEAVGMLVLGDAVALRASRVEVAR